MLTFLNNIFLPALATAVLPILIHLLTRRRLIRVKWPSLRFLIEIQKKQMKRLKLRQILLLILRVLILLLVIGAFARPAIRGVFATGMAAHENTAVALLIDRSYSMGQEAAGVDLFTRAKHIASDIIMLLEDGDELLVVPFDDYPKPLSAIPTRFLSGAHENIDSLLMSDSGTDVLAALARAVEVLDEDRLLHKEIYVLTDDRAVGWHRGGKLEVPERTRVYIIPLEPDDQRNIGIAGLEFPRTLLQKLVPFEITATVKSFAPNAVSDHVGDLYIDNMRMAQASTDLLANGSAQIRLSAQVSDGGYHWGRVELEGDALPADNSRYFSMRIPERLDVLVAGGAESIFIAKALAPENEDFFRVTRVNYSQLPGQLLSGYDVVILSDPPVLNSAMGNSLRGFAERGGGIVVFLGGSEDPAKSFESIYGNGNQFEVLAAIGEEGGSGRFELRDADFDHPVFMPYRDEGLPTVVFQRIAAIEKAPLSILTLSNGLPAIAEGTIGDGRIAVCAFSANLLYGNIATTGFLLPVLHRVTQYIAEDVAAFDPGYIVGDEVIRTLDEYPANAGAARLISPDGSSRFVTPRFGAGKTFISTGVLDQAGIYRVSLDTVLVDLFAVNSKIDESASEKIDRDAVERAVPVVWLNPDSKIEEEILSARYGRELHHGMLVIAFLLMFAELALGSSWRRPKDLAGKIRDHGTL